MQDNSGDQRRSLGITVAVALIRWYQVIISPLIGPSCRFSPTCSAYAIEAIQKYGLLVGLWRAAKRIARCHPWHPGGYDPP
ncbi:MAG: membrane protein insertion efficiency factor YidD [Planctomycetota bacterium]